MDAISWVPEMWSRKFGTGSVWEKLRTGSVWEKAGDRKCVEESWGQVVYSNKESVTEHFESVCILCVYCVHYSVS